MALLTRKKIVRVRHVFSKIGDRILSLLLCCALFTGCTTSKHALTPNIRYDVTTTDIDRIPTAFEPLSREERETEWGKELFIGEFFAREMDLYRALTCFKRALILISDEEIERRQQIEYDIIQSYYFGEKYWDAIAFFEASSLTQPATTFPAVRDLLIMMYDSYEKTCQCEKADRIISLIDKGDAGLAAEIQLYTYLAAGDIPTSAAIAAQTPKSEPVNSFLWEYHSQKKSPQTAETLNAVLPGAGYYYVGQTRSAVTSFIINTLFIWATYKFISKGYVAAGLITASLETGWYLGGINGAGLAAHEYNTHLYNSLGKGTMIRNDLFPVLMFSTAF